VIVISLLVLAAFGGVVWLAYNNGVARGHADIPGVVAQNTAGEQPAAAPGSGAVPPKQIKIYQQQAGADEDMNQTVVAPAATQPAEHALAMRTQPVEEGAASAAPAKPTPKPVAAATPKPVVVAPAKPPAALAVASAPAGAFVLQIGAYKSQSDADAAWKTYQSKHAALLAGFAQDVQKADLGDKGVWYRLRVGSFADKAAAAALCDRLKADGGACFPAK
jgi:cell division protein FtsN